jgi:hypothetical protein
MSRIRALTYGQWLHIKTTSIILLEEKLVRLYLFSSIPVKVKLGAIWFFWSTCVDFVLAIGIYKNNTYKKLYCYRLEFFAVTPYFVMILGTTCSVRKVRIVPTFRLLSFLPTRTICGILLKLSNKELSNARRVD